MLAIRITPGTGSPIYRQVVDQIRWDAVTGSRQPGEALPSVRALAERLVVNPNTVAKAYAELARDGVIEGRRGKGYFIAERRRLYSAQECRKRLDVAVETLVREALFLDFAPADISKALDRRLAQIHQRRKAP